MTNSTQYTAVVDRIVDGDTAVFIIEDDSGPIEQIDVPLEEAPPETVEGDVFTVTLTADGELEAFERQPEAKAARLQRNRERLDRLGEKLDRKRDTE